jgi:hypothetical protein
MSEYNTFDENVYSDEFIPDHLEDIEDVHRLMAEEGYLEFSTELEQELNEQEAWKGSKEFSGVLIKKACEHSDCPHVRCAKAVRVGGIEV